MSSERSTRALPYLAFAFGALSATHCGLAARDKSVGAAQGGTVGVGAEGGFAGIVYDGIGGQVMAGVGGDAGFGAVGGDAGQGAGGDAGQGAGGDAGEGGDGGDEFCPPERPMGATTCGINHNDPNAVCFYGSERCVCFSRDLMHQPPLWSCSTTGSGGANPGGTGGVSPSGSMGPTGMGGSTMCDLDTCGIIGSLCDSPPGTTSMCLSVLSCYGAPVMIACCDGTWSEGATCR